MLDFLRTVIDLFLHLDKHMDTVIGAYGGWVYLILFAIIFCETGLVVTPILPGDSLLFAVGVFAARGSLSLPGILILLSIAAILGDTVNYWIGKKLAPRLVDGKHIRLIKRKHLDRTHEFFERYGPETIIIARFVPIVRTFAPFVAGIGSMSYLKFLTYNVVGGILWVVSLTLLGYFFGNIPIVQKNFAFVEVGIIFISLLPGVFEIWRAWRAGKQSASQS